MNSLGRHPSIKSGGRENSSSRVYILHETSYKGILRRSCMCIDRKDMYRFAFKSHCFFDAPLAIAVFVAISYLVLCWCFKAILWESNVLVRRQFLFTFIRAGWPQQRCQKPIFELPLAFLSKRAQTFHMEMSLIFEWIKLLFIWNDKQQNSLWKRGQR